MKPLSIDIQLCPDMPDDRLYTVDYQNDGHLVVQIRDGFLTPEAVRDMEEIIRHMTRAQLYVQDDEGMIHYTWGSHQGHEDAPPLQTGRFEVLMDVVNSEHDPGMGCMTACYPRLRRTYFTWVFRSGVIRPELIREHDEALGEFVMDYQDWRRTAPIALPIDADFV